MSLQQGPTSDFPFPKSQPPGVRIYIRFGIDGSWIETDDFVLLSHTQGGGNTTSTIELEQIINPPGTTTAEQQAGIELRQYSLIGGLGLNLGKVDVTTEDAIQEVFFMVSKFDGEEDQPIFIGTPWVIDWDIAASNCSRFTCIGIDGMLDRVGWIGAAYWTDADKAFFFNDTDPVYNPRGLGNKRETALSGGWFVIEEQNINDPANFDKKWAANDILNTLLYTLKTADLWLPQDNFDFDPYKFMDFYLDGNFGASVTFYTEDDRTNWINESGDNSVFSDYRILGKQAWSTLVEVVEAVGPWSCCINYQWNGAAANKDARAVLTIYRTQDGS